MRTDPILTLRKEEVKKFINTIIFFRYSDVAKIKEFLESLQAIQINDDEIVLVDNRGERRDIFKRNNTVTLPNKFSNEDLNRFQIVQSTIDPLDFTIHETWGIM